ncbi:MAG: PTS sugar transporter subunit IIA [Melioribacteraceae bacterium]|nr:PTS sugar transporter subunit IIA [Melioribacteraceae bacterium]
MSISKILNNKRIITDFSSTSKEGIINELVDSLKGDENIIDLEIVREVVLEREKIMSTGIGSGFAIPHGKTNAVKGIVAVFGKLKNPIDFDSIDGKPVNLIFLMVGREDAVGEHIKMLSRISRIMNKDEVHSKLLKAETADEILKIFEDEESNL